MDEDAQSMIFALVLEIDAYASEYTMQLVQRALRLCGLSETDIQLYLKGEVILSELAEDEDTPSLYNSIMS